MKYKKVAVISVCYLFECPIITREPLTQLASTFDWGNLEEPRECS